MLATFVTRQLRPIIEGTVAQYFDFSLVPDFGNGQTVLQYGYLDTHFSPAFRVALSIAVIEAPCSDAWFSSSAVNSWVLR